MKLFQNGHTFGTWIRLVPPSGKGLPFIQVEMVGMSGTSQLVIGKLDTGAFMTMLSSDTAGILGIEDIQKSALREGTAWAANDKKIPYYVHSLLVNIPNAVGEDLRFPLQAGFSDKIRRNLFGIDWLNHMCIAVDSEEVHLLRD